MELEENRHIVMQWNDSILLPLITAFLMLRKKLFLKRMVAINIHDRPSSEQQVKRRTRKRTKIRQLS
jgi:hypothetical protein